MGCIQSDIQLLSPLVLQACYTCMQRYLSRVVLCIYTSVGATSDPACHVVSSLRSTLDGAAWSLHSTARLYYSSCSTARVQGSHQRYNYAPWQRCAKVVRSSVLLQSAQRLSCKTTVVNNIFKYYWKTLNDRKLGELHTEHCIVVKLVYKSETFQHVGDNNYYTCRQF